LGYLRADSLPAILWQALPNMPLLPNCKPQPLQLPGLYQALGLAWQPRALPG
jgi:hypothetical protein